MTKWQVAPELDATAWFNAPAALHLAHLRGRVVVLHAFQMLCPGCILHGIPQAQRIHNLFAQDGVQVIGLHTVFEHHEAMTPVALKAFLHEYQIRFPVGVDRPAKDGPVPATMAAYGMRGTPTTVIVGREGELLHHGFGSDDDLALGILLGRLLERPAKPLI